MCGLYIAMLQNPGLGYVWFVHCYVTEPRARVCVVFILLQNPGLEYVWLVYCHVTESRARVCVVCILPCYRTQG